MKQRVSIFLFVVLFSLPFLVPIQVGQAALAPSFSLRTLEGDPINADMLKGRATLLVFWASWCGVCRREMPNVKALYEHKKEVLQVLAIGFSDSESNIRRYVRDNIFGPQMLVAYDEGDRVSKSYRVRATPTFFLLNAKGDIVASHIGGGFLGNPAFQKFLMSL